MPLAQKMNMLDGSEVSLNERYKDKVVANCECGE